MLEIKKISKEYVIDVYKQRALDNVSISFRDNEFVSILGPSGSGKTTLLNIIGGLDHYDSGDLIINGVSTKNYKDRDFDTYRNHRIGFIFQSYNLISHQSVLSNVELALTLAGISKTERRKRAKEALIKVGLEEHINKKPNQLSGGQMQRVAIARALVNNPDILLADEPTGALDTKTSVQIMELLREVAKDKLVIMVTHNPELAKEYSSRIVELKDGKITSDSNPFKEKKGIKENSSVLKKTIMSFMTALSLSFNNLMVKKKRTILVSFGGSIGIIGIALILSLSTGFQNYIDKLQQDTLSSYPLTITTETTDITSMLLSMVSVSPEDVPDGVVREKQYITEMFSSIKTNDLKSFKKYLEDNKNKINGDLSSVKYSYSVSPMIYTRDVTDSIVRLNPSTMLSSMTGGNSMMSFSSVFSQMIDDQDMIKVDYDLIRGKWPKNYDEAIIVLSDKSIISDMLVYSLGLRSTKELNEIIRDIMMGKEITVKNEAKDFTYEDLMNIELKIVLQNEIYKYNSKYNIYEDMSEDMSYMEDIYNDSVSLKIVGIVVPKSGSSSMALSPGVAYTSKLTDYVISKAGESNIVKRQLDNKDIDVFSNSKFDEVKSGSSLNFEDMISIDEEMLASAFGINLDANMMADFSKGYIEKISSMISVDISESKKDFNDGLNKILNGFINWYGTNPKESVSLGVNSVSVISLGNVDSYVNEYMASCSQILKDLEEKYVIPSNVFSDTYKNMVSAFIKTYISGYVANDSSFTTIADNPVALFDVNLIQVAGGEYVKSAAINVVAEKMGQGMVEAVMKKNILTTVTEYSTELVSKVATSFKVDQSKIASAFKFNMSEEELSRLMSAMSSNEEIKSADSNLIKLGYQDLDNPSMISLYFSSFDSKQNVLNFIDNYNDLKEKEGLNASILRYTDTTGLLMDSVKKIVDSVSYVLIAFVSISLVVSSIMIGIITYISVLERTKEIGILRAIGASKRNISSIFNAETFIVGLLSGGMGIFISLLLLIPINSVIHAVTGNMNITAVLPLFGAIVLIILSVILTLIGGLIPSRIASHKDPVEALRTE